MAPRTGRRRRPTTNQLVTSLVSLAMAAIVAAWSGLSRDAATVPTPTGPGRAVPAVAHRPADGIDQITAPALRTQILTVIDSMDRSGKPPPGVSQGGRRGGTRGGFENAEGRLPAQPRGYYIESDVWPKRANGRGAERLVFGRDGGVWYSADHYRSFVRVR